MTLVFSDILTPLDDLDGLAAGRLLTTTVDGRNFVVVSADLAYGRTAGFAVAELTANGALETIDSIGSRDELLGDRLYSSQGFDVLEKGNVSYIYTQGSATPTADSLNGQGISVLKLDASGTLSEVQRFAVDGALSSTVSQNGVDPAIVTSRGKDFLIQQNYYDGELISFRIKKDGTLSQKDAGGDSPIDSGAMDAITKGGAGYVVSVGPYLTAPIVVDKISGKGKIERVFELDPDEPLLFNRIIVDIKLEKVGNKTFAFVAESTGGTILVYELNNKGELLLVAQEQALTNDRWGYPYSIETFEVDGQTYLVTGGNDQNMAVLAVSANGALTEVDEFEFESNALRNVNELAVTEIAGRDFVLASVPIDSSLRSFRFDDDNPTIDGGGGKNTLTGTDDDDRIFGKGGADQLFGEDGDDLIEGGGGRDQIFGGNGRDDLYGGKGKDRLEGEDGDDWLFGGAGSDVIIGGDGRNYAVGGAGKDTIETGNGDDRLFGGAGDDDLSAGIGKDRISDGAGSDRLSGGDNQDVFIFANDGKTDFILDFEDGFDKIDLRAEGDSLIFPDITVTAFGAGVRLDYAGERIVLTPKEGAISVSDIGLDDFILA